MATLFPCFLGDSIEVLYWDKHLLLTTEMYNYVFHAILEVGVKISVISAFVQFSLTADQIPLWPRHISNSSDFHPSNYTETPSVLSLPKYNIITRYQFREVLETVNSNVWVHSML